MKSGKRKRGFVLAYAAVCTALVLVLLGVLLTAVTAQERSAGQTENEIDCMIAAYAVGEAFCAAPELPLVALEERGAGLVSLSIETLGEGVKRLTVRRDARVLLLAETRRTPSGVSVLRYEAAR